MTDAAFQVSAHKVFSFSGFRRRVVTSLVAHALWDYVSRKPGTPMPVTALDLVSGLLDYADRYVCSL